jgi:hypothetical protein
MHSEGVHFFSPFYLFLIFPLESLQFFAHMYYLRFQKESQAIKMTKFHF